MKTFKPFEQTGRADDSLAVRALLAQRHELAAQLQQQALGVIPFSDNPGDR